jgi:hypothetical protein
MTDPTPAEQAARRERYAAKIREEVRLRLGTNALALAERGQPVQMNFSEAATAADSAIAVADAEQAELRTANERMRHELEVMYGGAFDKLPAAAVPASAPTNCICGDATESGIFHRADGPCYVVQPQHRAAALAIARTEASKWADGERLEDKPLWQTYLGHAAAVLAVLPAPTDRAAVLRDAAERYERLLDDMGDDKAKDPRYWQGVQHVTVGLRRLADAASVAGLRGEAGETQQDPVHAPGMPCENGCRAAADELARETQQDQTQAEARPPAVTWQIESPRRDTWTRWSGARDTAEEGREEYDRAVEWGGERRSYRLVRAETTYTVVAEHQPAVVSQPGKETGGRDEETR